MQWGDRYAAPPAGPPVLLEHRGCGGAVDEHRICETCGARLSARDARALAGPGATPSTRCDAAPSARPPSRAAARLEHAR